MSTLRQPPHNEPSPMSSKVFKEELQSAINKYISLPFSPPAKLLLDIDLAINAKPFIDPFKLSSLSSSVNDLDINNLHIDVNEWENICHQLDQDFNNQLNTPSKKSEWTHRDEIHTILQKFTKRKTILSEIYGDSSEDDGSDMRGRSRRDTGAQSYYRSWSRSRSRSRDIYGRSSRRRSRSYSKSPRRSDYDKEDEDDESYIRRIRNKGFPEDSKYNSKQYRAYAARLRYEEVSGIRNDNGPSVGQNDNVSGETFGQTSSMAYDDFRRMKSSKYQSRTERYSNKNVCFRCLKPGHIAKFCTSLLQ